MLLSVVVPVYNAGSYLEPCLQSILRLQVPMEIIVVDDGSTDGAVDALTLRDPSLIIVRQQNQGVSVARNVGLERARGEWIWFIDADDEVSGAEIDLSAVTDEHTMLTMPVVWRQDGRTDYVQPHDGEVPYNLWRCWFRRACIEQHHLRFVPGRKYGEDQEFILHYLLSTGVQVRALTSPQYHYTMRPTGAMLQRGRRWQHRRDMTCVLCRFAYRAFISGQLIETWVLKQIKRLLKTISAI
ncbi:MAG: glycosyltransferase family 2 protein [Bacteroidales bacterium]|nr:glycosyltransferase family 2 protein [Bacteroidales bacterium]